MKHQDQVKQMPFLGQCSELVDSTSSTYQTPIALPASFNPAKGADTRILPAKLPRSAATGATTEPTNPRTHEPPIQFDCDPVSPSPVRLPAWPTTQIRTTCNLSHFSARAHLTRGLRVLRQLASPPFCCYKGQSQSQSPNKNHNIFVAPRTSDLASALANGCWTFAARWCSDTAL